MPRGRREFQALASASPVRPLTWLLPEKLTATQEGQRAPGRCGLQAPEMLGGHRQNEQNVFCNNERDGGWKVLAGVAVGTGCPGTWVRGRKSEGWAEGRAGRSREALHGKEASAHGTHGLALGAPGSLAPAHRDLEGHPGPLWWGFAGL